MLESNNCTLIIGSSGTIDTEYKTGLKLVCNICGESLQVNSVEYTFSCPKCNDGVRTTYTDLVNQRITTDSVN